MNAKRVQKRLRAIIEQRRPELEAAGQRFRSELQRLNDAMGGVAGDECSLEQCEEIARIIGVDPGPFTAGELLDLAFEWVEGIDLNIKRQAVIEHRRKVVTGGETPRFVPSDLQAAILKALDGRKLKVEALADEVAGGDSGRLYRNGGLSELYDRGLVVNERGKGCYRPDAPPK